MRSITCKSCGGEYDRDDLVASIDDPSAMRCPDCDTIIFRTKRHAFAECGTQYSGDEYRIGQSYADEIYQNVGLPDCD